MKKIMLFMMAVALTGQTMAAPINDDEQPEQFMQEEIVPVTVTYLDNVYSNGGWDANWFVTVQGGMSAFLGKPVGHGDFFDRTKPLLNISAGKWITPTVAVRASFQGFQLTDAFMEARKYQNLHADLMYNITNAMREDYEMLNKWDLIPYIGIGLVHNSYNGAKPFGMTLGIAGRYRLTDRLHLTGEISNTFTSKAFDGWGENKVFGDNLAQASIGLTYTIGKNGWKRVVDPKPYIFQNDQLMSQLENANNKIHKMNVQKAKDAASLAEMRKILEIEGLLDKYDLSIPEVEVKKYPKNNYSGLNSLRARLRGKNWNEDDGIHPRLAQTDKVYEPAAWNAADTTKLDPREYFRLMKDGKIFVGTPVFFFFRLGTTDLNEKAQIINVREIASVIKRYGLSARVVGAADSQTGSAYTNEKLSQKRAQYIADLLKKQGVPEDRMELQYRGGINSYIPMHGNRNTCILLYFK